MKNWCSQLLEYKMFKYMSYELRDRMADASRCVYRAESMPKEVLDYSTGGYPGTDLEI